MFPQRRERRAGSGFKFTETDTAGTSAASAAQCSDDSEAWRRGWGVGEEAPQSSTAHQDQGLQGSVCSILLHFLKKGKLELMPTDTLAMPFSNNFDQTHFQGSLVWTIQLPDKVFNLQGGSTLAASNNPAKKNADEVTRSGGGQATAAHWLPQEAELLHSPARDSAASSSISPDVTRCTPTGHR